MSPEDAAFPGYEFSIDGAKYFIGLFNINNPDFPDIVYPSLLTVQGGDWVEIDKRQAIWMDLQEDIQPDIMAGLIIKDFNKTLKNRGGSEPMTWNQELAAIFRLRLSLVDAQLVIT